MKKYSILVLVLVLTALALAGCRNPAANTEPTSMPTGEMTTPPSVMPSTEAVLPSTENTGAANSTNPGAVPGDADPYASDATGTTEGEGNARRMPGVK